MKKLNQIEMNKFTTSKSADERKHSTAKDSGWNWGGFSPQSLTKRGRGEMENKVFAWMRRIISCIWSVFVQAVLCGETKSERDCKWFMLITKQQY